MGRSVRGSFVVALTLLCACSGSGSGGVPPPSPQTAPVGNTPTSDARTVQLGPQPTTAAIPIVSGITGTLSFPAVATPATLELSASATAPAGVALESVTRAQQQSGTLTVYEYFTLVPTTTVTLPDIPAVTLKFPALTPVAGKSFAYGISDLNAQGGLVSFDTQGPGAIAGQTVSFAQVRAALTFFAGHKYTFVVYATATATKIGASKIYVVNDGGVDTYDAKGTPTTPTITAGINGAYGIAVDASGKIYVVNNGNGNYVSTYDADGTRTTPTISGLPFPVKAAVDGAGKIYVLNDSTSLVTTYHPDGTPTTPTIMVASSTSLLPGGIAVAPSGQIYVSQIGPVQYNDVSIFNANGTHATPPLIGGLVNPQGIAVDAGGKLYVTNADAGTVTTYNPDGTPAAPTITTAPSVYPVGVAVDAAGKIYVLCDGADIFPYSAGPHTLTIYNADGTPASATITLPQNIAHVRGIAVH